MNSHAFSKGFRCALVFQASPSGTTVRTVADGNTNSSARCMLFYFRDACEIVAAAVMNGSPSRPHRIARYRRHQDSHIFSTVNDDIKISIHATDNVPIDGNYCFFME